MKRLEVSVSLRELKPVLADALMLIKDRAAENLKANTKRAESLPEGWEHIEDALVVREGKSNRTATAFCKVFRKKAPQAIWIEFGHRIVGHRPNRKDTGRTVAARPFFRPAIDAMRAAVRKKIDEGILKLLWDSEDK